MEADCSRKQRLGAMARVGISYLRPSGKLVGTASEADIAWPKTL